MVWPPRAQEVEPTDRQQQVLDFIRWHLTEQGYPPSIREIGRGLSLSSTSTVAYHLDNLERMGRITRGAGGLNRSIRLVTQHGPCPTCGHDPVSPASRLHEAI